jgi:hypothetical protein
MPHYDFDLDFPVAKETEAEVANLLVKEYGAEIISFENTNKYDILARIPSVGEKVKIEVKEDFIGEFTGNVGLEYECRGKPSGIQTTQADYYIYKLHTRSHDIQFVMHPVSAIKKMIDDKEYFRIVNGGDKGSNSMNYLFRYDVFVKTGKIIAS